MTTLDRGAFLHGRPTLKTSLVDVPEFGPGSQVLVEELTALEKGRLQGAATKMVDGEITLDEEALAKGDVMLVLAAARSAPGVRLLEDADQGVLLGYGGELIGRIADEARKLSGLDKSAKKARESAKGN
jgi:hypothetical protein